MMAILQRPLPRGGRAHTVGSGEACGNDRVDFEFSGRTIRINMATRTELEAEISRRFRAGEGFALATVNLDHLAKMSGSPDFVDIYARQDLVVADGRPVVWLSRLARRPVSLMPGSDMVRPLCRLARAEGMRIALVGSTEAALRDAEAALTRAVPGLEVALCIAPSGDFDPQGEEAGRILAALGEAGVGLCFLALGAPRQEALAARGRSEAPAVGFASVGAGLDFLGGHQHRAPRWMRALALEWLWRALSSPRRMIPRYARCFAILPGQTARALRKRGA